MYSAFQMTLEMREGGKEFVTDQHHLLRGLNDREGLGRKMLSNNVTSLLDDLSLQYRKVAEYREATVPYFFPLKRRSKKKRCEKVNEMGKLERKKESEKARTKKRWESFRNSTLMPDL
jgi:hypothetical protein